MLIFKENNFFKNKMYFFRPNLTKDQMTCVTEKYDVLWLYFLRVNYNRITQMFHGHEEYV